MRGGGGPNSDEGTDTMVLHSSTMCPLLILESLAEGRIGCQD